MIFEVDALTRRLREWAERTTPEQMRVVQNVAALEMLSAAVLATPVDTGHLRANWTVSVGQADPAELAQSDRGGGATIKRGQAVIGGAPPFSLIYVQNNLPYAQVVDRGEFDPPDPGPTKDWKRRRVPKGTVLVRSGHSVQAPQGMSRIAIAAAVAKLG